MRKLLRGLILGAVSAALVGGMMPQAGAVNIGNEGCTPGYWKNHQDNWEEYKPTDTSATTRPIPRVSSSFPTSSRPTGT